MSCERANVQRNVEKAKLINQRTYKTKLGFYNDIISRPCLLHFEPTYYGEIL